jgi:tryptophan synthase alpha chain
VEAAVGESPLDLIRLVAPTTRADRLARAVAGAEGFIYLIARLGVTGATARLAGDLAESIARVRRATPLPIAVGFGISTPAQAATVAGLADGVVVGSAFVDRLGREGVAGGARFLSALRAELDRPAAGAAGAGAA